VLKIELRINFPQKIELRISHRISTDSCKCPTEETMCAQNFNFDLKFPQNKSFSASKFAFFDEKFLTRRRFSDSPKFRGGGASGHDATDCPQVRGCPPALRGLRRPCVFWRCIDKALAYHRLVDCQLTVNCCTILQNALTIEHLAFVKVLEI